MDLASAISMVNRYVSTRETRFAVRAFCIVYHVSDFGQSAVTIAVEKYISPESSQIRAVLLNQLLGAEEMETDEMPREESKTVVDLFVSFVVLLYLVRNQHRKSALKLGTILVKWIKLLDMRLLDPLSCRIYILYFKLCEDENQFDNVQTQLFELYQNCAVRRDIESLATLMNLILRHHLCHGRIEQASVFVETTAFPKTSNPNQMARFMYYVARIRTVQLEYTLAYECLQNAVRYGPRGNWGVGFQQTVYKLMVVVQLLLGKIPPRNLFRQAILSKALDPYFCITLAVRGGNLHHFQQMLAKHSALFKRDKMLTLVLRLGHNVLGAGMRSISVSYSRIRISDIASKLGLEHSQDAEMIVSKAIRDKIISARLVDGIVEFGECDDSAVNLQNTLYRHIDQCNAIHRDVTKAIRHPEPARDWSSELPRESCPDDELSTEEFQI